MNYSKTSILGWKEANYYNSAVMRKRSRRDFWISVVIAFLVIFVICQIIAQMGQLINLPLQNDKLSLLNPLAINVASAATADEALNFTKSGTIEVLKGSVTTVNMSFKNLGVKTWKQSGNGKVDIKILRTNYMENRGVLTDTENKPGQIGNFKLTIRAPGATGTFSFYYSLARNDTEKISGGRFTLTIKVVNQLQTAVKPATVQAAAFTAAGAASSAPISDEALNFTKSGVIELLKGSAASVNISFKNQGAKIWKQSGAGKVDIKILRTNYMENRGEMINAETSPGQIGLFKLTIKTPSATGTYSFNYSLVRDDTEKLSGGRFSLTLKVVDKLSNGSASNIQAPVAVIPAVAPAAVKPQAVPVAAPVAVTDQMAIGRQCLDYSVKKFLLTAETQKIIDQCQRIGVDLTSNIFVEDGADPIPASQQSNENTEDNPAQPSNPNPAPNTPAPVIQSSSGPSIRIGLYNTIDPIRITANAGYKILDQNKLVLAVVPANQQAVVSFNFSSKTYTLEAPNTVMSTSSYMRFEGDDKNIIFEILSYDSRPKWNQTLNDNRFLTSLELRYSPNTGKLWVINELEMENYLKGLAETTNVSHIEYQKALVTAARTYAMYHLNRGTKHAAEYFTIDAYWDQVYKGYNSQIRMPKFVDAANQTNGMMVTYNGEVVVTPYFSHSDGRTRDWTEVWGGSAKPWCKSVKEPDNYDKTTMFGHGVGLSAHGALHLAYYYNYTYDNILKYYYTGVEVKKIY